MVLSRAIFSKSSQYLVATKESKYLVIFLNICLDFNLKMAYNFYMLNIYSITPILSSIPFARANSLNEALEVIKGMGNSSNFSVRVIDFATYNEVVQYIVSPEGEIVGERKN